MNIIKTEKISVVGVGGGAGNVISHIATKEFNKIDLIAINTDITSLNKVFKAKKIQIGKKQTKGLGSGMNPKIGRDSAIENYEDIKESLKDSNIVFIVSTLGGGTSSFASCIVAKACKEVGSTVISIVTTPFDWEGKRRIEFANLGMVELKNISDNLIVISNNESLKIISSTVKMKRAFELIDDLFFQIIKYIVEKIIMQNSDIENISNILKQKLFSINYKNSVLEVSIFHNSVNEMCDLENIQIEFPQDDLDISVKTSSYLNKYLKHF